ncbi:MAG: hypothetical protein ACOC9R_02485, partial [bacterium]
MSATLTLDELATEIRGRLDGISTDLSEKFSDQAIAEKIRAELSAILADPESEFARKIRFGRSDPELVGTKYARMGLSVGDVEWLHDVLRAAHESG